MSFMFRLRDGELRVRARAKWIRSVYRWTLWPDKLQEGWTRCPTVVLLWLTHTHTHTHTHTLCMLQMQPHACKARETCAHSGVCNKRERELVIMQECFCNSNTTNTSRCSASRLSLASVCGNQAQPCLADRTAQLLADCLLSKLKWDISWAK